MPETTNFRFDPAGILFTVPECAEQLHGPPDATALLAESYTVADTVLTPLAVQSRGGAIRAAFEVLSSGLDGARVGAPCQFTPNAMEPVPEDGAVSLLPQPLTKKIKENRARI
ncbi:MAG: hypothetical protein A2Z47_06160 [Thermodesulfovibrio sp. RBG_19FT_COMBO_42_12]|nr:MAG: hypothetical protein A2Z47_06160 [Thermodesulfovibrio sp. RBG_19FT_COMBO_42_12]